MLISARHRFIFVHIYKNAGTSVTQALLPFAASPVDRFLGKVARRLRLTWPRDPVRYPAHLRAHELIARIGRPAWDAHTSFAIVRNPWAWQVSLYRYALQEPTHPQHGQTADFAGFTAYLHWRCEHEVRLQRDFIHDPADPAGPCLVTHVARFETLETDFAAICRELGLAATLPRLNVTGDASATKPYREFYTPETEALVRQTFAPDIETFGYEF